MRVTDTMRFHISIPAITMGIKSCIPLIDFVGVVDFLFEGSLICHRVVRICITMMLCNASVSQFLENRIFLLLSHYHCLTVVYIHVHTVAHPYPGACQVSTRALVVCQRTKQKDRVESDRNLGGQQDLPANNRCDGP